MPRRPRVLVFEKEAPPDGGAPVRRNGVSLAQRREARRDHDQASQQLRRALEGLPVSARYVALTDKVKAEGYDLVIALGGDGTVLHASHQIGSTPVLAINSAPRHSVGFLTATTVDGAPKLIEEALSGGLGSVLLQRMAIEIDGRRAYGRVLNDVLFSHGCPASTARYVLRFRDREERQTSSGIWIGPAAGSTAAQRSAGGRVLRPGSKKLQFVVREPYQHDGARYALARGVAAPGDRLEVLSLMDSARLYVDGPHVTFTVRLGQRVAFSLSEEPLSLLGFRRANGPGAAAR